MLFYAFSAQRMTCLGRIDARTTLRKKLIVRRDCVTTFFGFAFFSLFNRPASGRCDFAKRPEAVRLNNGCTAKTGRACSPQLPSGPWTRHYAIRENFQAW